MDEETNSTWHRNDLFASSGRKFTELVTPQLIDSLRKTNPVLCVARDHAAFRRSMIASMRYGTRGIRAFCFCMEKVPGPGLESSQRLLRLEHALLPYTIELHQIKNVQLAFLPEFSSGARFT